MLFRGISQGSTALLSWFLAVGAISSVLTTVMTVELQGQGTSITYENYTPRMCSAGVIRLVRFLKRTGPDTAQYNVEADTIADLVQDAAHRCASKFDPAHIDLKDTRRLGMIYLAAGDDESALLAIDRYIYEGTADSAKVSRLGEIIGALVSPYYFRADAIHPRPDIAELYMRQLAEYEGAEAGMVQLQAYKDLATYYLEHGNTRGALDKWVEYMQILTRIRSQEQVAQIGSEIVIPLLFMALREQRSGEVDDAYMLVDSVITVVFGEGDSAFRSLFKSSLDALPFGDLAPDLEASYVLNAPSGTSIPRPGVATYIVWAIDRPLAAILRRVKAKLGDSVEFVLPIPSAGHFKKRTPLVAREEADSLQRHYIDVIGFPGIVMITETPFQKLPDGRYIPTGRPPNLVKFEPFLAPFPILIDANGRVQPTTALPWHKVVEKVLLEDIRSTLRPLKKP